MASGAASDQRLGCEAQVVLTPRCSPPQAIVFTLKGFA
jgi:hypothetical protein